MKILQIAPIIERVPPKRYGGTERVVHALTEELVKRGHEVTLFASGDSLTSAKLVSIYPRALREAKFDELYTANTLSLFNIGLAYQDQDQFDIIHDHNGILGLPAANIARTPVVMTYHGPFFPNIRRAFSALRRPYVVSISDAQANVAPSLNRIATVHNGLAMEHYPFSKDEDGYLLFVGRISMEKGTHIAIDIAQYLDIPLIIAAKLDKEDVAYFNEYVGPRISDSRVKWIGEVTEEERNKLMSRAMCLLHPITWPEPFGLTMIEAMACGAPVIGINRGSVPEIVEDGVTGFVANTVDGMIDAVQRIGEIDREACRKRALGRFNAERMASGYEEVYRVVITAKEKEK